MTEEEHAIVLDHDVTDETGNPLHERLSNETRRTCPYVGDEVRKCGLMASYKGASGIHLPASLLRAATVIMGKPWFSDPAGRPLHGFVDESGKTFEQLAPSAS